MDALEKVIRPIVEGQIRGFVKEHPEVVSAVNWYNVAGADKSLVFINSISKRIVRDLICDETKDRIASACCEIYEEAIKESGVARWTAPDGEIAGSSTGASPFSTVALSTCGEGSQAGTSSGLAASLASGKRLPTIIFAVDQ